MCKEKIQKELLLVFFLSSRGTEAEFMSTLSAFLLKDGYSWWLVFYRGFDLGILPIFSSAMFQEHPCSKSIFSVFLPIPHMHLETASTLWVIAFSSAPWHHGPSCPIPLCNCKPQIVLPHKGAVSKPSGSKVKKKKSSSKQQQQYIFSQKILNSVQV